MEIQTFNSVTSTGGKIWVTHNPRLIPLCVADYDATSSATLFRTSLAGVNSNLVQMPEASSLEDVKNGTMTYALLPHTTEFEECSNAPHEAALSDTDLWQQFYQDSRERMEDIFPSVYKEASHHSYNQAIVITAPPNLAAPTGGTDSGLTVVITAHFHVNLVACDNATNAWSVPSGLQLTQAGVSDPQAASAINSAIAKLRLNRAADPISVVKSKAKPATISDARVVIEDVGRIAPDIANKMATFLPQYAGPIKTVGSVLGAAASFASGFFKKS